MSIQYNDLSKETVTDLVVNYIKVNGHKKLPGRIRKLMDIYGVDFNQDVVPTFGKEVAGSIQSHINYFNDVREHAQIVTNAQWVSEYYHSVSELDAKEFHLQNGCKMFSMKVSEHTMKLIETLARETNVSKSDIIRFAIYDYFRLDDKQRLIDQRIFHTDKRNRSKSKNKADSIEKVA